MPLGESIHFELFVIQDRIPLAQWAALLVDTVRILNFFGAHFFFFLNLLFNQLFAFLASFCQLMIEGMLVDALLNFVVIFVDI